MSRVFAKRKHFSSGGVDYLFAGGEHASIETQMDAADMASQNDFQNRATLERLANEFGEINCCYDDGRWHISDLSGFSEAVALEPNRIKGRIAKGFYDALEILGGQSDVLAIAGSYGDTLGDEGIAEMLEEWVASERAARLAVS